MNQSKIPFDLMVIILLLYLHWQIAIWANTVLDAAKHVAYALTTKPVIISMEPVWEDVLLDIKELNAHMVVILSPGLNCICVL